MATFPDQDFVEYVVRAIVEKPEEVKTSRAVDEMGVLITLKVHKDDMGGVIGKQGATARALRTLLRVVGAKHNARVNLKIEEPEGGRGPAPRHDAAGETEARQQSVDDVVEELKNL
jgi:predicted RNA-binding protein YlqC (UPF0109 family)